jgi:SAM-dependent methyltransferase
VLSTQVLEHVQDPDVYLAECARLLRPGGSLVLSTHGSMYYHADPDDYWRWTMAGLALLVERHGLVVEQRVGVLGLRAAAVQVFQDATVWSVPRPLRRLYTLLCQVVVGALDRGLTPQQREDNGLVVAVRAVRPPAQG